MIQILGLLGMYFDAVVVEVKTSLLLFRWTLAILCHNVNTEKATRDTYSLNHNRVMYTIITNMFVYKSNPNTKSF